MEHFQFRRHTEIGSTLALEAEIAEDRRVTNAKVAEDFQRMSAGKWTLQFLCVLPLIELVRSK